MVPLTEMCIHSNKSPQGQQLHARCRERRRQMENEKAWKPICIAGWLSSWFSSIRQVMHGIRGYQSAWQLCHWWLTKMRDWVSQCLASLGMLQGLHCENCLSKLPKTPFYLITPKLDLIEKCFITWSWKESDFPQAKLRMKIYESSQGRAVYIHPWVTNDTTSRLRKLISGTHHGEYHQFVFPTISCHV